MAGPKTPIAPLPRPRFPASSAARMIKAWLQLFRFPNLLTVPGDPLAAFLIATGGRLDARVWPVIGAALCLYAAGLAMNDLADYEEDKRDRPRRPLPSGAVSRGSAWLAVVLLSGAALALLGTMTAPIVRTIGVALLAHIGLYNFLTKRIPYLGAINMGVCRALSLALGAVAGQSPDATFLLHTQILMAFEPLLGLGWSVAAWPRGDILMQIGIFAGVAIGLYIMAVTNLARYETQASYPRLARFLPVGMLLVGYIALKDVTGPIFLDQAPTLWVVALVLAAMNTNTLMKEPAPPLPPRIGSFIRVLPVLQAALCLQPTVQTALRKTPDSLLCAVILLFCVPLHAWLGKKFYAS